MEEMGDPVPESVEDVLNATVFRDWDVDNLGWGRNIGGRVNIHPNRARTSVKTLRRLPRGIASVELREVSGSVGDLS